MDEPDTQEDNPNLRECVFLAAASELKRQSKSDVLIDVATSTRLLDVAQHHCGKLHEQGDLPQVIQPTRDEC